MGDPKGDKLYVDLPASQVRRRLKGFGHGVRKVQSAGKCRAVIIHTATGHHLDELMAVLGDVRVGASQEELDMGND
jgi:DNA transformation protein and related proteins